MTKLLFWNNFQRWYAPMNAAEQGRKIPSLTAAEKLNSGWAGSLLKLAKMTANKTWWTSGQGLCSRIPVALPFMNIYHCTMVSCFFLYIFKWTDLNSYIRSMHCLKCIFWILMSQSFLELEIQILPLLFFFILKCVFTRWTKSVLFFLICKKLFSGYL